MASASVQIVILVQLAVCSSLKDLFLQIAVLSDVLEDNGMDMDAILEAHMGGEACEEEEEEAGMDPAAAEGPDVEGELGVKVLFHDSGIVHAVHAGLGLLEKASFMCVATS